MITKGTEKQVIEFAFSPGEIRAAARELIASYDDSAITLAEWTLSLLKRAGDLKKQRWMIIALTIFAMAGA